MIDSLFLSQNDLKNSQELLTGFNNATLVKSLAVSKETKKINKKKKGASEIFGSEKKTI